MYMNKIRLYQDKDWLEEKYWKSKLSTTRIARLCDCDYKTIWNWLVKFDISRRSIGEGSHLAQANHCNLSQKAIDWINGELLGDGYLWSRNSHSANFQYTSKYREYIQYISDTLKSFGIEQAGEIRKYYRQDWDCSIYKYQSRSYVELLPIFKQWYPEPKRKKIIPKDITLTSLTLRQFYIGDGCLIHKKKRPCISLATCGFTIEDVEWLIKQLIKLGFKTKRWANNAIGISTYSTKEFLDYIGSSPIKCYDYKWDYNKKRGE